MALLLRFSASKLFEGQASGSTSDLSLDVSMVEIGNEEQVYSNTPNGSDVSAASDLVDGLLSPLRNLPSQIAY